VFAHTVTRRRAACAALVLVALALSACSSSPSPHTSVTSSTTTTVARTTTSAGTSTTAAGTQEVGFDPYSAEGTILPSVQVTQKVSGTCVSPGVAGTTSYRCFAQPSSRIYDPCFAPPRATSGPLECFADPTSADAVEFDIGALPAAPSGAPATRPWAMQLSDGQVCVLVNAAWGGLGPFACPIPAATSSLVDCHAPEEAVPWWSASCQPQETTTSPFAAVRVAKVWT